MVKNLYKCLFLWYDIYNMKKIIETLEAIQKSGWAPDIRVIKGISSEPILNIDGKRILSMCSANYLGLANDDQMKKALIEGIEKYGLHPTGSRLISGTQDIHLKVENEIAKYKNQEGSVMFNSGTHANIGIIPAITDLPLVSILSFLRYRFSSNGNYIFSDEFNHASIIDGCRLSKAEKIVYKHLDMDDLESKLAEVNRKNRKLIISDGVFSMDGDITPLPKLVELAKEYNALLMIDDAHGTGVIGKHGGGTTDFYNIKEGVDIHMGTFSKSFGLTGGFVAGSNDLVEFLKISARTYIFSGALWGSVSYAVLKALDIFKNEPERRVKLHENSNYFRDGLKRIGFNILGNNTPIIPLMIGDEMKAKEISKLLYDRGIFVPYCAFPAVEKGKSRLRFSIISTLEQKHLDYVLNNLSELKSKLNL